MNLKSVQLCCFMNWAPFYRRAIFEAMHSQYNAEFYINTYISNPPKRIPTNDFPGFRRNVFGFKIFGHWKVISLGIIPMLSLRYSHYLLTADSSYLANWFILYWGRIMHKKVFLWGHGPQCKSGIDKRYSKFVKLASGFFVYGEDRVDSLVQYGVSKENIFVIHNSLDTSLQSHIFGLLKPSDIYKQHFNNSAPVVIYIGRLQKRKKVNQIIDAIDRLKENGTDVNLTIIGDVKDDDSLVEYTMQKNISKQVWFFGPSYDESISAELIYNADVCVSPGSIGLTAIHCLSYGTPVITNNDFCSQMPEYLSITPGKTGAFYPSDDIDALACTIEEWTYANKRSRELVRVEARKKVLEEWSVDYQINVFDKAFEIHESSLDSKYHLA